MEFLEQDFVLKVAAGQRTRFRQHSGVVVELVGPTVGLAVWSLFEIAADGKGDDLHVVAEQPAAVFWFFIRGDIIRIVGWI